MGEDLTNQLQSLVDNSNTMLVETELEGDNTNQCWYEYDKCEVSNEGDIVSFFFTIGGKRSGAFITRTEHIKKYELYKKEETVANKKHFYIRVKGKPIEPLVVEGMSNIFNNQVPLEEDFFIEQLYNSNRETVHMRRMAWLNECYKHGLFNVHKFHFHQIDINNRDNEQEGMDIYELKEYPQENEYVLKTLLSVAQLIENAGFEVKVKEKINKGSNFLTSVYARVYVPEWKLIISPETQNISTILNSFAQKDTRVCIVSSEGYYKEKKVVGYLIERKKKFYEIYEGLLKYEMEQQAQIMGKVWKNMGLE